MFKVYTPPNFSKELTEVLKNVTFSIELLIGKDDILKISKSIFNLIEKDIHAKIIISSNTSKKSLRIYNLINRLIDCGVEVYWNVDLNLYKLNSHFLIFDKVYVVNKIFYNSNDNAENQVLYFLDIFSKILSASTLVELNSGQIKVVFNSEKTFVKPFEPVLIKWKIKNADVFKITPTIDANEFIDETTVQLENDTLFKLTASNKNEFINKFLFVKVNKYDEINFYVKVFDPILKESIFLNPLIQQGIEKYSCYWGQSVSIGFKSNLDITLKDLNIGNLTANEDYNFISTKSTDFHFKYNSNGIKKEKIINITPYKDSLILKKINYNHKKPPESLGFIERLKKFFYKLQN